MGEKHDWSSEDYDIDFSYTNGQLTLKAKNDAVFCPAIGTFNGTLTLSARQLFRRIPKRFLRSTVFIQVLKDQKVTIDSHSIPAHWVENPVPQGDLAISLTNRPDVLLENGFIRRDEETTGSVRSVWYEKTFDPHDSQLRLTIQVEFELDIYDDDSASYTENRIYSLNDIYLLVTDRQMEREGDKHSGYYYEDTERPREIDRCRLNIKTFEQLLTLCNMIGDNLPNRCTESLQKEDEYPSPIEESLTLFGSENKIFTEDKANKAREILRKKLGGINMGVPLNPDLIQTGDV